MYQFNMDPNNYALRRNIIVHEARQVRTILENAVGTGTDLCGYCIEASEELVRRLRSIGFLAETREGWVEYTDPHAGYQRPYDAHTWVEVVIGFDRHDYRVLIVDVTGDQFNCGRCPEDQLPGIMISPVLPKGYQYHNTESLYNEVMRMYISAKHAMRTGPNYDYIMF